MYVNLTSIYICKRQLLIKGTFSHKWPRICTVCRNHNLVLSWFMTYHPVCNKSNMMGISVEQELPTLPEHLSSPLFFLIVLIGFVLFKSLAFMFLVLCWDVRLDFHLKTMSTLICFVGGSCFMYTGVQHDFHIRWCLCRLTVTRQASHVEQKLSNVNLCPAVVAILDFRSA